MSGLARRERWGLGFDAMEEVKLSSQYLKFSKFLDFQVEEMEKKAAEEKENEMKERKVGFSLK